jgi:hypothetical protein
MPLIPNPKGQLINPATQAVVPPSEPRYSSSGEQLDAFNRPLPPGAVPMFTETGMPIGVGPDGNHYTINGQVVDRFAPHYDAAGKKLAQDVVNAADLISTTINVAIRMRAKLKGENSAPEAVDPLGRALRADADGKITTTDGHEVAHGVHRVEIGGQLLTYEEAKKKENVEVAPKQAEHASLVINMENDSGEYEIGTVEIDSSTTLVQVRVNIQKQLNVDNFVFLVDGVPLTKFEERSRYANALLPSVIIRGQEMRTDAGGKKFTTKVAHIQTKQEIAIQEEAEFLAVLNKVRNKSFLNPVGRDLTK